jgi:hypothetical protein
MGSHAVPLEMFCRGTFRFTFCLLFGCFMQIPPVALILQAKAGI